MTTKNISVFAKKKSDVDVVKGKKKMSQDDFFKLCDVIDEIEVPLDNVYYPTIQEMIDNKVTENIYMFLPYLLWLCERGDCNELKHKDFTKYANKIMKQAVAC